MSPKSAQVLAGKRPPRKRLSRQLYRVVALLEIVNRLEAAEVKTIHRVLCKVAPVRVCLRTVERDLPTLAEAGFLRREIKRREVPGPVGKRFYVYRMQEPKRIAAACRQEQFGKPPKQEPEA